MLHFLFGRAGSGKTTTICERAVESLRLGRRCFIIVPEQQALDTEQQMAERLGSAPSVHLEVLNFKRLCNRIFRQYGGLSKRSITDGGKALLMWQTIDELSGMLENKHLAADRAGVTAMLSAVAECKAYRISPSALEHSLAGLQDDGADGRLRRKLSDLSLILASYTGLVASQSSDPADDLTRAAELLGKHDFFAGADVYLDSFNGFTPQQFEILRRILLQADNLTVALCTDGAETGDPLFDNIRETARRIRRLADDARMEWEQTLLEGNHRVSNSALETLEKHLWSLNLAEMAAYTEPTDAVTLIPCANLFAECEAAALRILDGVRAGASWRDFAIVTRGLDRYDGILDVTFEKYGIPFFLSRRSDITHKPLIKLILALFTVRASGFASADLLSCLKTGLLALDPDEVSEVETYAETWSIRGRLWFDEWTMNPRGYRAAFSPDAGDAARLDRLNALRRRFADPLASFYQTLDSCHNVREYAGALYDFLLQLEIPARLEAKAAAHLSCGEKSEAEELSRLWDLLMDVLDELCLRVSGMECDSERFVKLLSLLFESADMGRIPSAIDEVTVGDASLLRKTARHMILIGVNEGIFPLAPRDDSFFTDTERERLQSLGIELADGTESRALDERFTFWRVLASASESVCAIWSLADLQGRAIKPSLGVLRLSTLFPGARQIDFSSLPLSERLAGWRNLPEFAAAADPALRSVLTDLAAEDPAMRARLKKQAIPLSQTDLYLEPETAALTTPGDLALSQSKLDRYVLCHFSYFCQYILHLDEARPARFDAADIGSLVHRVLEAFASSSADRIGDLSEEELDRMVDGILHQLTDDIRRTAPDALNSGRLNQLFVRLGRSSRLLCRNIAEEFRQSDFRPAFYELPIRFPSPGEESVDPLEIELADGSKACIYGIADRVDTLKKDGKLYIRVVDYKTGSKEFSLSDISMGLNLQMLLYLFSLWKNGNRPSSALKPGDDELIPAGVLYFSANVPTVTPDSAVSADEVTGMVSEKLARSGLLLDDPDVLTAMEKELAGRYLPFKKKKDGYSDTDSLKSLEEFGRLLSETTETVRKISGEIKRGNASAHPIKTKKHNACAYCAMKPICRRASEKGD